MSSHPAGSMFSDIKGQNRTHRGEKIDLMRRAVDLNVSRSGNIRDKICFHLFIYGESFGNQHTVP